jgi:hypothetical protein
VQPAQRLDPGPAQLVPPVAQQPQHLQLRIDRDLTQAPVAQRHHHDRVRVGRVGLAALPGVEHPRPGGQLGGNVHDPFPVGQQPRRDRAADSVGALHGPRPLRPLPPEPQQLPVAAPIGAEPAPGAQHLPDVAGLDRDRRLVRIHPDHHSIHHAPPLTLTGTTVSEDGQRCFEQIQQTLLEPRPAAVTGPAHAK